MKETKAAAKKSFNWLIRPEKKLPPTDQQTMTVPVSTLTLRQIKERYANGMFPTQMPGELFYDDGKSNGLNPLSMDFNDIQAMQDETYKKVAFLTQKVAKQRAERAERLEKQVQAKKATLEKEIEAYLQKFGKGDESTK